MSRAEQYAWASATSLIVIYLWFQMRMLDGWRIVDQPASELLVVYFAVIVLSTIAEIIIASCLTVVGGKAVAADERDRAIEARANQNERLFIIVAVNVLVWQALMEGAFAGHRLPRIDLQSLPTLFFALFTILFAGELVKRLSTIWLYRTQSIGG